MQDLILIVDEADGQLSGLEQVIEEELRFIIGNLVNSGYAPDIWQEAYTQAGFEALGIGLTAAETVNLLTILITSGYTAAVTYLINLIE